MKRIRFRISLSMAAMVAVILALDNTGIALLTLLCAACHEAGHFAAFAFYKIAVEEVDMRIFGVSIRLRNETKISYGQELVIAVAGCIANLLLCALAAVLYCCGFMPVLMSNTAVLSFLLFCFNALPIAPLDGGRVLEVLLLKRFSYTASRRIVALVSVLLLFPLAAAGFFLVVKTGYNFSLMIACVYLFVSLAARGRLFEIV